ncbi:MULTISPECIES: ribonuclease Y [Pseudothermotoga]|jgi:ribonuclease Y|uniref:Ribonuclease Y n=2 Tax=Pseudothermotoga TaxID=1643951 RepID=RNY_PSELT|nr:MULTISPECIES: ribonuclease Y [Pseudothermotoga]A8F8V8.1 RecName: Full=Ribonuclease Y; Short=RNase Y [Pseudothermotoga lettingae TMO]ABV34592.1 metal dependent phosphohydrolase [Pseudothermotoga lettingae TMO]KUK21279.1 MAG: Ribonuclease Y [Pseudothermotoga lettingae]MDI3494782.1 ribonucrease [Pseudothermotoga sp.]MDK2883462.1 ribonucrease [Pseudothermotoga sp.]GLI48462.1 ribonuclease Y [Pseudothermotoga lettingae TMO]
MIILVAVVTAVISFGLGYVVAKSRIEQKNRKAQQDAVSLLKKAEQEAQEIKRKAIIEAREEVHKIKEEIEEEKKRRDLEHRSLEERLLKREEIISKREELVDKKETALEQLRVQLEAAKKKIEQREKELDERFTKLAGMTVEEARQIVIDEARQKYEHDLAILYKKIKENYEEEAEKEAKKIIATAVQRYAPEYIGEITVSTVSLPSDDMKGRIIGREGRNIRTFEKITGVDLIIDDTPEVVVLSSFNPIRREIARLTLEKLVTDGRIHPARIEEMYEKSKQEMEKMIKEAGQEATFVTGVTGLHPELIKLLGKLKFRTSYGQNVLDHSIEVAQLAALMAEELGLDVDRTRRGGLLHDIGKALDHEVEGSHTEIGAEIARRYGESDHIINMIMSHHGEQEPVCPESVLVAAADALSAARPGARRESLETYIRRLVKMEKIAMSFKNVEKAYAIQAGREVRVIVEPEKIDDVEADKMAYEIAKKIEEEVEYPGVLKVVVIREKRSIAYAK